MAGILQKLMAATGKSADEIMEVLGKSKSSVDEIDMGDISSPALKRGRPANSPLIDPNEIDLGKTSRKNIETGDIVSDEVPLNELDLGDAPAINPTIDDLRLPTVNPNTARGVQGGGLPPALMSEADEMAGPLAVRGSTLPDEVPVQVLGKGTPSPKASGSVIDAELVPPNSKVSTMDALREFGRKNPGKIVGGLTLAEMARQMMGSGGEQPPVQIPMAPQAKTAGPESVLPDNYMDLAEGEDAGSDPSSSMAKMSSSISSKLGPAPTEVTPGEDRAPAMESEDDMLERAQRADSQNQLMNGLLRAGIMGGAAFAGTKGDYSAVDVLDKNVGQNVRNVKDKQAYSKEKQSMAKAKAELDDDSKLRDTNSDISKTARELATKLGIKVTDKVSAKQLQDAGLPLGTLLSTQIAADSRREMAALAKDTKASDKEKTLNEKQRKFVQGLRKEATTGVLGKQYATFSTGQRMGGSLQQFSKNPSGYTDYATLMGGLKTLQGDESVVREAEVRLGMSAASAIDTAYNYLQKLKNGQSLQPGQREQIISTVNILTNAAKDQYMQSVAPILEQAEMEGIDSGLILSGSLSGAKGDSKPSESGELTTSSYTPAQEKAIALVMSNNNVDRNKAVAALKKEKKL